MPLDPTYNQSEQQNMTYNQSKSKKWPKTSQSSKGGDVALSAHELKGQIYDTWKPCIQLYPDEKTSGLRHWDGFEPCL